MRAISVDELSSAIQAELSLYNQEVTEGLKKEAKSSMKKLVERTKSTAPVGRRDKHYRDSITSKKLAENANMIAYLWYVKGSDYRLSHLLNNGHALRGGGRYEGTNFISDAELEILAEYQQHVEEIAGNG